MKFIRSLALSSLLALSIPAVAHDHHGPYPHGDHHFGGHHGGLHGDIVRRQTDERITDQGYTRKTILTDKSGKTATRDIDMVRNPDGSRIRTVSGVTFDGKHYSGQSVMQPTAHGFNRHDTFSGPGGKTLQRDVAVSNDRDTITRTVKSIGPDGKSLTDTRTITLGDGR